MALVCSDMDTTKLFQRSPPSLWAEIKPHFSLRLKEEPRPPYAHRDFDKLRLDFPELKGYFPVPWTLNSVLMALVFSDMDTTKAFQRSPSRFSAEI